MSATSRSCSARPVRPARRSSCGSRTDNLSSNAERDRRRTSGSAPATGAITSLPLHYCYGLSVLHSHLVAGAAVVVTEASVVDPCFTARAAERTASPTWPACRTPSTCSSAAVTERMRAPTLRFLTQAGGRLAPDRRASAGSPAAERWGAAALRHVRTDRGDGPDGVPAALDRSRAAPASDRCADPRRKPPHRAPSTGGATDVGELVYRGPNVMLGYATDRRRSRRRSASSTELATGDVARFHADDGVFEIVGRRSRFVKPFGVRVDLDAGRAGRSPRRPRRGRRRRRRRAHRRRRSRRRPPTRCARTVSELVGTAGQHGSSSTTPVRCRARRRERSTTTRCGGEARRCSPTASVRRDGATRRNRSPAIFADRAGSCQDVDARRARSSALGGDSLSYVECSIRARASSSATFPTTGTCDPSTTSTRVRARRASRRAAARHDGGSAGGRDLRDRRDPHGPRGTSRAAPICCSPSSGSTSVVSSSRSRRRPQRHPRRTAHRARTAAMPTDAVGRSRDGARRRLRRRHAGLLANNYAGGREPTTTGPLAVLVRRGVRAPAPCSRPLLLAVPAVRRLERRYSYAFRAPRRASARTGLTAGYGAAGRRIDGLDQLGSLVADVVDVGADGVHVEQRVGRRDAAGPTASRCRRCPGRATSPTPTAGGSPACGRGSATSSRWPTS